MVFLKVFFEKVNFEKKSRGRQQKHAKDQPLPCWIFLCTTLLPKVFLINLQASSHSQVFTIRMENSVDSDQLASQKPADPNLQCFQNSLYQSSAWYGLIQVYKNITLNPSSLIREYCIPFLTLYSIGYF